MTLHHKCNIIHQEVQGRSGEAQGWGDSFDFVIQKHACSSLQELGIIGSMYVCTKKSWLVGYLIHEARVKKKTIAMKTAINTGIR